MAAPKAAAGNSVTSRALSLLDAFDDRHRRLSLTRLAERANLPLPTAHRLAGELVVWGALERTENGYYVIGRKVWDLGHLAPVRTSLREIARPFLNDFHAATRATVHLAVRDGERVLYLERLSGVVSVPIVSTVGTRLPLHATGVGKVLLAHAPQDVRDTVLRQLDPVTPHTITQAGRLNRQLERVRTDGYATTSEEMSLGACSLAVPVTSGDPAQVVAAIGTVVPNLRRDRPRLLSALQVAAQGVARSL